MSDSIVLLLRLLSHPVGKLAGVSQIGSGIKDMQLKLHGLVWAMPAINTSVIDFIPSLPFQTIPRRT